VEAAQLYPQPCEPLQHLRQPPAHFVGDCLLSLHCGPWVVCLMQACVCFASGRAPVGARQCRCRHWPCEPRFLCGSSRSAVEQPTVLLGAGCPHASRCRAACLLVVKVVGLGTALRAEGLVLCLLVL
jgi:hypothetical protein